MRVIVDGFGGDHAPLEVLRGARQAATAYGHDILLCGNVRIVKETAEEQNIPLNGIEILDCDDVIGMEDPPRSVLKEHKDCSMAVGLRALAEGKGDALVSAGNTGALLMGSIFYVKRIQGIARPALAAIMPSDKGPVMLVDSGANAECRPEMLLRFAQMGSIYMSEVVTGGREATVGLLNVGTEDSKGGTLQRETFSLLSEGSLHFVGNVEAREVPFGAADVIVADGFSGNVLLKTMEGTADLVVKYIKQMFMSNLFTKAASLLVKPQLADFKKKMSTAEYGGAPLLGVKKPVIKTHGNAKAAAIQNAIRVAAEFARRGVIEKIAAQASLNEDEQEYSHAEDEPNKG